VTWVNQIIQGILLGGYYALLASGLSLMFGVMRIINLAHGDLAILGAFAMLFVTDHTALSPFAALAIVLPATVVFGALVQRSMLERSLRSGVLIPLLTTFGLAIVIQNALFEAYGADTRSLGPQIGDLAFSSWILTDQIYVGHLSAIIFGVAIVVLVGLQLLLQRTSIGRALRATAEDPDTAGLVGVNARAVYAVAAGIAVAIAALAGVFLAMRSSFDSYSGPTQLIFAFEAVVIGGLGSLWGTLAGGILLGVAQTVGAQLDPQWQILAGHVVFLVILAIRLIVAQVAGVGGVRALLGQRA
jgi:branched-subunit amino acid ABC-type transport system permease component